MSQADHWVDVLRSRRRQDLDRHLAVLEALGVPHNFRRDGVDWVLAVPVQHADHARRELIEFETEESEPPPPPEAEPVVLSSGWIGIAIYVWALILVDRLVVGGVLLQEAGLADSERIRAGEWWRAFTALTMHADTTHLAGNLVFGALFARFLSQSIGTGVTFLAMLLAGALGNVFSAWVRSEPVQALGASTAVFAGVGLLSAISWLRRQRRQRHWTRRFAPWIVGLVLLGFLGTGNERTDIVAHGMGFVAGGLLGTVFHRVLPSKPVPRAQWIAGACTLGLLAIAWGLAMSNG